MSHRLNILRIKSVNQLLGSLRNEVVFVGGATVSLYADRQNEGVRETLDVDILVELFAHKDYAVLDEKLRKMGFENDIESGVLCRYKMQGLIVDIMPTGENVLGFSNRWYPDGFANAIDYVIDEEHTIKIFNVAHFIASKLEAFKNRGRNKQGMLDGRTSTDFEDIVFVFENRLSIWDELPRSEEKVKHYLQAELKLLLTNPFFEEWVDAHAGFGSPPATYYILERLNEFINS